MTLTGLINGGGGQNKWAGGGECCGVLWGAGDLC